jgi:hypothetical protein
MGKRKEAAEKRFFCALRFAARCLRQRGIVILQPLAVQLKLCPDTKQQKKSFSATCKLVP